MEYLVNVLVAETAHTAIAEVGSIEVFIDVLVAAAAIVGLGLSALALWISTRAHRAAVRPILVFFYADGWWIENVGNGPALDVVVAGRSKSGEEYKRPCRLRPLGANAKAPVSPSCPTGELCCNYIDFDENPYSSICEREKTRLFRKHKLPRFAENDIERFFNPQSATVMSGGSTTTTTTTGCGHED